MDESLIALILSVIAMIMIQIGMWSNRRTADERSDLHNGLLALSMICAQILATALAIMATIRLID